jgi:light-harvesting protein B-800-850 alpha chain
MNQGRIWCVVNPSIGLPLFLGSVALMSFTVHFAVLNNTTWIKDYWSGVPQKHASVQEETAPVAELKTSGKATAVFEVAEATTLTANQVTGFVMPSKLKVAEPGLVSPVPD